MLFIISSSAVLLFAFISSQIFKLTLSVDMNLPIVNQSQIPYSPAISLIFDPPDGFVSNTGLGVFVRALFEIESDIKIYYEVGASESPIVQPTLSSGYATPDSPYILLNTPFKASRNRILTIICVVQYYDELGDIVEFRSHPRTIHYVVEASARPYSYGFLVPGVESSGMFIKFGMEVAGKARAQTAGGQEFANFFTELGKGTYDGQVRPLNLTILDQDLVGFEGGFPANFSNDRHYGILIPFHNGKIFHGKVVRIDIKDGMENVNTCIQNYRMERRLPTGQIEVRTGGNVTTGGDPCVVVLDLASVHPNARGFRKGFNGFPYGYLSPGQFNVLVRLDLDLFTLNSTRFIDLTEIDPTYGGYSGGFADGTWACFNPFRSFSGPVGGIRSMMSMDANHLRPYYYAVMLCVNESAWNIPSATGLHQHVDQMKTHMVLLDFGAIEATLRGFSEVIRAGRYAYFAPLSHKENEYSSKVVRLDLGNIDIGTQLLAVGEGVRSIVDILDLNKRNNSNGNLRGYSGVFQCGTSLILVPYRNAYEPKNGQRGHGFLTRLNLNDFSVDGVDFIDTTVTERAQIPSFADVNLRGFSGGFATGSYGVLVPFFNSNFNGKLARFKWAAGLADNLQELDLEIDALLPDTYHGYRGGWSSLWQGVDF